MEIRIIRRPDGIDPFDQGITVTVKDRINGETFGSSVQVMDLNLQSMTDVLWEVARLFEKRFLENPKTAILAERVRPAMATALQRFRVWTDEAVPEVTQEKGQPMLPKEILIHLEKGDRTDEFVVPKHVEGAITSQYINNAVQYMRNAELQRMHEQMIYGQQIAMGSSGLVSDTVPLGNYMQIPQLTRRP